MELVDTFDAGEDPDKLNDEILNLYSVCGTNASIMCECVVAPRMVIFLNFSSIEELELL